MLKLCVFFFFKQKTAYEMRISDWSSDVCSSDLGVEVGEPAPEREAALGAVAAAEGEGHGHPAHLRGDPVGELRERRGGRGGRLHVARVAVGQDERRDRPHVGAPGREGQVGGEEVPVRREAVLHGAGSGYSSAADRKSTRLNSS